MAYYQHNMLSIKSRNLLANILAEIVLLSQSIQTYREALANIPYFDCIALFRLIDHEEKGYLRQKDFQRVIGTSHRKLLTYAFSWFDNMKVGEISRLQFSVFLLPKDNLKLRQLVAQRVQSPQIAYSQHETILQQLQIFRNLILQIMNKQMIIIELRRQLISSEDYTGKAALAAIDCNSHDWIVADDIYKFMKNYGFDVNLRHVQKLVQVLNYNLDGKIVEQQLKWTIEGFQSNDRQYLRKIKATNKKQHKKPQSKSKSKSKSKHKYLKKSPKVLKQSSKQWQALSKKIEQAASSYNEIDKQLQEQQQKMIAQSQRKLQQTLLQCKRRQQLQLIDEIQHKKRLMESYKYGQIYDRIQDNLAALQQIQKRNHVVVQQDMQINQDVKDDAKNNRDKSRRLYSFAEQSFQDGNKKRLDTHPEPQISKRDYAHLHDLNNLSLKQSYRKASSTMPPASPYQLIDSSNYINTANNIKQRIRVERQIEKSIQDKFKSGQYDTSRFNSKISDFNASLKSKELSNEEAGRNVYRYNAFEGVRSNYDNGFKSSLGLESVKKEDSRRYNYGLYNAIPDKSNKLIQKISTKDRVPTIYESPERVQRSNLSGVVNKQTAATKAFQSTQK